LIVAIGVLPEYQRKRIGKALLLTVEEKARRLNKKNFLFLPPMTTYPHWHFINYQDIRSMK